MCIAYLRKNGRKDLDLFRKRRWVMLPVQQQRSFAEKEREVDLGIMLPDAYMWPSTKDEEVLCTLHLSIASEITLGIKLVWSFVDVRVA